MWKMVALLKARLSDAGQAEASGSRFESMTMNRLGDCLPVRGMIAPSPVLAQFANG